ncbi:acetate--CoA ligase family protein [Pseudodesulfovibrio senegalensis]|uniref:CoA-binding domain-containing protein n=1 Tax=Pseudodesulfovibrio senegalensis TaxID=1721087 RepID=A0A6N6MZD3_9BACT|nr:acetate--CoA ligase family protein [Pseudodesulfovibrio senegalensis]KAB1438959.1 hypothetical protein F8A88_14650 [Pseudodesulfovibrio senegalensis]
MFRSRLDSTAVEAVEQLLDAAHADGRSMLFEHEVYAVLERLGMSVPEHVLVQGPDDVGADTLARFSSDHVVLKAVAPDMIHKEKAGGVRVVVKDLEYVRYSVERMVSDMAAAGIKARGVLLMQCVDYSQELGNEILLGFRESVAFGPVISFSKGGSDAEHFARCFSAPNLILAPIDRPWAEALLYSTNIQQKYETRGWFERTSRIVDAGLRFSKLSTAFSNFFPGSRWVLREFEVNPLVFDRHERFWAIDGYAEFAPRDPGVLEEAGRKRASLRPFFEPRGVAVVGVSATNPASPGSVIVDNLVRMGRTDVFAVNPRGGQLELDSATLPMHTSVTELPEPVELAVVAVPAGRVVPVMEECARAGVRCVVLIPGGFGETGRTDAETDIRRIARDAGMRVMGPNCLGLVYGAGHGQPGMNTFFIPEEKFSIPERDKRNVAILSQSGALGIIELHQLRNAISPKAIVSYGNQLDTDPADLVGYFSDDDDVAVIACYIEGFKPGAGARFFEAASHCPKPVIVYKAGRTEAGMRAAQSHTASIAGEYAVAKAAMKQAGVVVAESMMDHVELTKTFAMLDGVRVNDNRVAVIANAGYEKTYGADNLGSLRVAELDAETLARLGERIPAFVEPDPLLDLTPMADDDMYLDCMEIMLSSPSVDCLLVSIVPHSMDLKTTDREMESEPENIAVRMARLAAQYGKPVAVSVCVTGGADADYNRLGQTLEQDGVPTFLNASRAMRCLDQFVRYAMSRSTGRYAEWLKQ